MSHSSCNRPVRLFPGALADDFDATADLALGPWCYAGNPPIDPFWHRLDFPASFADADALYDAGERVAGYCEWRIRQSMPQWNAMAGSDHGMDYWLPLAYPWLFRLAELTYVRLSYIRQFIARHHDTPVIAEIRSGDADWAFSSMLDYSFRGLEHPDFSMWINSLILRRLAPPHWHLEEKTFVPPSRQRFRAQPPPRFKTLRRLGRKLMPAPRFDNSWGVSVWQRVGFSLFLGLVPARRPLPSDWQETLGRDCPIADADFIALMDYLEARTCPAHLGKDYHAYRTEALKNRFRPGRLRVGPVTWVNERDLFLAAHARDQGEKVVSSQYGCHYGTAKVFPFAARMQYRLNAFLTWGWSRQQDYPGRFLTAPSPYLSKLTDRHRQCRDDIVFVSTVLHAFMSRLHVGPQIHQIAHYRRFKERFLRSLGPNTRPHLTYRPHHLGDWDFEDMGFVRRIDPAIPEVGGNQFDLTGHLLGCRLLVLDNPGTTLHIALAANIPTIGFWQKDAWQLCRQAQPIYDAMAAAGMVFHSPEEAAAKIESILPDVQGWWHSEPVQAARLAFCREHARTSRWWWWDWLRLLARLSWSR